ncbi:MAG: hypothetical protein ACJAVZ_003525 [Afipia broomeae]|jgi:hypothetical protein|tara:strand:+ start:452 stop:574 length:123 start_codon:yes stop_codon:yes gene_type:complete
MSNFPIKEYPKNLDQKPNYALDFDRLPHRKNGHQHGKFLL